MPKPRISLRMIKNVIRLKWQADLSYAVSYTHLDVYKRQTMHYLKFSLFESAPTVRPLCLALSLAFGGLQAAQAEMLLKAVEVNASRDVDSLGLDQTATTGSRTGITNRELPASIEVVESGTMQERGDYQIRDAITRTTGLTDIGSGGTGGLSFSSRGFSGTNSVGIAEDGIRIQTGAGTQNYPGSSWGYELSLIHI